MPTRIAVVHNLLAGGARRRLASQIEQFADPVIELCLATAEPITDGALIIPLRMSAPRVPHVLRPPLRYVDALAIEAAWGRVVRRLRELRPDAIYLNPCRFLQAPPIVRHDMPPTLYFCDEVRRVDAEPGAAARRRAATRPLYAAIYARERALDRATARRVNALATNSSYTAAQIERAYGRSATVVRLGVPEELRVVSIDAAGARASFLLSVGTLIPSKGHDLVIRAAALAQSVSEVRIVAPRGDVAEQQRLAALAKDLAVSLRVHVAIPDAELGALYRTARATVYLAEREPLGLVSLEAQACGCPVIVAAEGGLPETIIEGLTGWSIARDPRAAAALLDRLADDDLYRRMSLAAHRHGESWSWSESARHVERLLAQLIGETS